MAKITIDVTHIYGPNDTIPGKIDNDAGKNDNNYGSGSGRLRVEDLDKVNTSSDDNGLPDWITSGGNSSGISNVGQESSGSKAGSESDVSSGGSDGSGNGDGRDRNSSGSGDGDGGDSDDGNSNEFLDKMAEILDKHFQTLTPSTPNIMLSTAAGALKFKVKSDPVQNATEIATKVAAYFALTIAPKPMGVSGPVTSCSNNAASIAVPLGKALLQLASSSPNDNYESFVQTIYNHIANGKITWNVTETIPGSPPTVVQYSVTVE